MKKKRFSLLTLLLAVLLTLFVTLGGALLFLRLTVGAGGVALLQGLGYLNTFFVGEQESTLLVDGALEGMVAATEDRWSYYMDSQEFKAQEVRQQNQYIGIGITVEYTREEGLLIAEVTPGGPADRGGLLAGELIVAVDGQSLAGEARHTGADLVRGEEGSTLILDILSAAGSRRTVSVLRATIDTTAVQYKLLEGGVGYIQITNFHERTAADFRTAVTELQSKHATGLIFDVRNNGGGYLDELCDMLDFLLPEGPIFRSNNRAGREQVIESDSAFVDLPMAVLVNEDSYSAAELFAAELQEQGAAVVVGAQTTGKGRAQQTFPLNNGGAINFSTQSYFTGSGRSLVETGVTPDVLVAADGISDIQLEAAVEQLS